MISVKNKEPLIYYGSKTIKEVYKGSTKIYPSIDLQAIMDSLVCWYDPGKQQCTNESMAANPVLADLSGNGHDMTCYNFAWTEESGISTTNYPNALVSDGVDDYCYTDGLPILTDYTVIAKRTWIKTEYDTFATFSSKTSTTTNGEFIFERFDQNGNPQVFSFGAVTAIGTFAENITYQTPTSYNGKVIDKGNFLGDGKLTLFGLRGGIQLSNIALYSFILFNRTLTTAEIEWVKKNMIEVDYEIPWYGVEWDINESSPDLKRIGNPNYHRTLPIQSQLKGCVAKGNKILYYLDPNDWSKKRDGTASVLDGTDGSVRVHVPRFYGKSEVNDNIYRVMISLTKIDDTWDEIPEMLIDAYRATVDTTEGTSTSLAKMVSVVNTSVQFRGGNNNTSYDLYLNTDVFRTMLGKPRTSINRATARQYANNAGSHLLNYEYYKWVMYWLPVIEYATFYMQRAYNAELTEEGYHQGGLGSGCTNTNYEEWTVYSANHPYIPCGYTNLLGNNTGEIQVTIPSFEATITSIDNFSSYSAITNGTGTKTNDLINITHSNTTDSYLSNVQWNKVSGIVVYHVTGVSEEQPLVFFTNSSAVATVTTDGDVLVDWGNSKSRRDIRTGFTGDCNITITIVSVGEPATITINSRVLNVCRYRGFENIFGDIWTNLDGILIDTPLTGQSDSSVLSTVYIMNNPDNYTDSLSNVEDKAVRILHGAHSSGYIKEFDLNSHADIIPASVGANYNTYKTDYYNVNFDDTPETLFVGGAASGSLAGLGCFYSHTHVSNAASHVGFRTLNLL